MQKISQIRKVRIPASATLLEFVSGLMSDVCHTAIVFIEHPPILYLYNVSISNGNIVILRY